MNMFENVFNSVPKTAVAYSLTEKDGVTTYTLSEEIRTALFTVPAGFTSSFENVPGPFRTKLIPTYAQYALSKIDPDFKVAPLVNASFIYEYALANSIISDTDGSAADTLNRYDCDSMYIEALRYLEARTLLVRSLQIYISLRTFLANLFGIKI